MVNKYYDKVSNDDGKRDEKVFTMFAALIAHEGGTDNKGRLMASETFKDACERVCEFQRLVKEHNVQ